MMRLVILVAITVILVLLLARLFPRFRAQVRRVLASPFVRRILSVSYTHLTLPTKA